MFKPGMTVKVHGKTLATVASVHKGGKRLGISFPCGKSTFISASAAAVV